MWMPSCDGKSHDRDFRFISCNLTVHHNTTIQTTTHITLENVTLSSWVSWSLTSLFSTNMAISEIKRYEWRAIPTQWRKARDILTSILAAFLLGSHPIKEMDREAHLNYHASAYNRGRQKQAGIVVGHGQQHDFYIIALTAGFSTSN